MDVGHGTRRRTLSGSDGFDRADSRCIFNEVEIEDDVE